MRFSTSISFFISLLLLCTLLLSSCSGYSPIKSSPQDAEIVASCDGHDIPFEQIRFLAVSHKADMAAEYASDIWSSEQSASLYADELKERVEGDLLSYATVLSVCKSYNIDINDKEIQESVTKEVEYVIENVYGDVDAYKEALAQGKMTDSFFRFMFGIYYCQNELYFTMTQNLGIISAPSDEAELYDLLCDKFFRTTHVYLPFNYGEKDKEENLEKINDIYTRLCNGEISFEEAQYEACADTALSDDGYYFSEGFAEPLYEEAVLPLQIDSFSEVVEMNGAFYIIKRLPLDPAYLMGNIYVLKNQYIQTQFNNILSDYKKGLKITYLKDIDLVAID